jgi:hypothetical protein
MQSKQSLKSQIQLLNPISRQSTDESSTGGEVSILKFLATLISTVGLVLTFIGFGVVLARAEIFSLEVTDICRSPVEFLIASTDLIVAMFDGLSKFPEDVNLQKKIALVDGAIAAIVLVAMSAIYHAYFKAGPTRTRLRGITNSAKKRTRLILSNNYLRYILAVAIGFILPLGASWFLYACIVFSLFAIAILPTLGYMAEASLIEKNIINPPSCQSFQTWNKGNTQSKKSTKGAICIRVLNKDGKEIARARRITRTADYVLLYSKATGKVSSVPTRDSIVEQVEDD